jgi:hypothetical protein
MPGEDRAFTPFGPDSICTPSGLLFCAAGFSERCPRFQRCDFWADIFCVARPYASHLEPRMRIMPALSVRSRQNS